MRLAETDRRFVAGIAPSHAEKVLAILGARTEVLTAMGGGVRKRSRAGDLRGFAVLLGRLARARFRTPASRGCDLVHFERNARQAERHRLFIRRFVGEKVVYSVTSQTSMAWPGRGTWRILSALVRALLTSKPDAGTEVNGVLIDLASSCLMALGHARSAREGEAFLYKPYRLEVPFIAACLMEAGIKVSLVVGTTPISAHLRTMVGDRAVLSTAYQVDEYRYYRPLGDTGSAVFWGPTEIVDMEESYAADVAQLNADVIGVYSQGFWVRLDQGSIFADDAVSHLELENRFMRLVERFAKQNPSVKLVLFPHPQERTRYEKTGEHGYGSLLELDNVDANWEGERSILAFDVVGLGLTTTSTVGFDRTHMGRRTLFMIGESDFIDKAVPSRFNSVFHDDDDEFLSDVDRARRMSDDEFMTERFGHGYTKWSEPTEILLSADEDE